MTAGIPGAQAWREARRSGARRAARSAWLIAGTAVIAAGAIGAGATAFMRAHAIGGWLVTVAVPVIGRQAVPAAEAGAAFIAAAVAVAIVLVWYAVRGARRRKRWRDNGPTVLHGDTASRVARNSELIRADRELLARLERDTRTNAADIAMIRAHLREQGALFAETYEARGLPVPELAPAEEPTTAWVPRVIEGGGGLDEAG